MRKIVEAEIMSEGNTRLRITLTNPMVLDGKTYKVIEGYSYGIMPEFDDDGEELDYDILAFKMRYPAGYCHLRDEDVSEVEKAAEFWRTMGEIDDAADGLYCVPGDPPDFDLKAAAKYAKEHGIFGITEEVREMFRYKEEKSNEGT